MSIAFDGGEGNHNSGYYNISISSDCRYVVFPSAASNLVPGDTNGFEDIFVRDRQSGSIERASVNSFGAQCNGECRLPSVSQDGRYVAFQSQAGDLVPADNNQSWDVFVRDRQLGLTERVSVGSGGTQGDGVSGYPSISPEGRYVAFWSGSTNLVSGDGNGRMDIFVHDRQTGLTERVSINSSGLECNGDCWAPSISTNGRWIAFQSNASNLVIGDTNFQRDIFLRDRQVGSTERISVSSTGAEADHLSEYPSISPDGRYVVFASIASNLVAGDTNQVADIFLRDRQSSSTERISVSSTGSQASSFSGSYAPASISPDGRYVAFHSYAYDLDPTDTTQYNDVFIRDRQAGTTELLSVSSASEQADYECYDGLVSADGRYVAFRTRASNLVPGDVVGSEDVFVRDRIGGTAFATLCDPGVGGVIPCPCSNPAVGLERGCNNSSGTGGAALAASGGTYLSSDSLVFTTSGEKPTALSIVSQWNASIVTGSVFGMGVRCGAGTLKRLYTKTAAGGSITAPDFGTGDPQVSVRSAALGDTIQPSQSRWYLVYYRDPIVLGGCPASSTFNATQTGQVTWSP